MKSLLAGAIALLLTVSSVEAQSLKPSDPCALQPGINKGSVDNFVGPHYWYFTATGPVSIRVQFKAMGLFGNAYNSNITVTVSDAAHSWATPKVLSSDALKPAEYTFQGAIKKPTKIIVTVAPPNGGLIRMGGDYQIEVTGAVSFGAVSTRDPVLGIYKAGGYTIDIGDAKFNEDGTITTTNGLSGTWKLFDKDSATYVINIEGQATKSLQLRPGKGLMDGDVAAFQCIR